MTEARFDYATAKTRDRAEAILEDMFAAGEVCEAERPKIEKRRIIHDGKDVIRYAITLPI